LLKEQLAAPTPIQPVLDRIAQTLSSGNQVWVVGDLPTRDPSEILLPELPPAPASPYGWADWPYIYVWGRQTQAFLTGHFRQAEVVPIGSGEDVSNYEKTALVVVKGWTSR
jgi:hypothetical protein